MNTKFHICMHLRWKKNRILKHHHENYEFNQSPFLYYQQEASFLEGEEEEEGEASFVGVIAQDKQPSITDAWFKAKILCLR